MTYRKGTRVRMTAAALENYGEEYRGLKFTIESAATKYMPSAEFFARGKPDGFHPGFDPQVGGVLYDLVELEFSLYDWEVCR